MGHAPEHDSSYRIAQVQHGDHARGRVLPRRTALAMLGATTLAFFGIRSARAATPAAGDGCVARPQQTEGPFFVEEVLERTDIRTDPVTRQSVKGTPLSLEFAVAALTPGNCAPLSGARIDVWQCDAEGRYSGVSDYGGSIAGQKFLRGWQATGADGTASFLTIYPGAYGGRAVHIHFKVRTAAAQGRAQEFTSQLYFDDALSDRILAQAPYPARRRLRNADDYVYRSGGAQLTLAASPASEGIAARFSLGLLLA